MAGGGVGLGRHVSHGGVLDLSLLCYSLQYHNDSPKVGKIVCWHKPDRIKQPCKNNDHYSKNYKHLPSWLLAYLCNKQRT